MILDLLEPQLLAAGANVLVGLLDEEIQSMKRGDSESRVAAEKNTVSASDGERARAEVENWRKKEVERLVGIPQSDRPPIRIPRDPIGSLLIASFDDFFERSGLTVEDTARGFAKDEVPISSTMLTDEARAFLSDQSRRRFWPKFGQRDARFQREHENGCAVHKSSIRSRYVTLYWPLDYEAMIKRALDVVRTRARREVCPKGQYSAIRAFDSLGVRL